MIGNQMPENRNIDLEAWDLHRAAAANRVDIARSLIARGDDNDAIWRKSLDVARMRIERGANTEGIDLSWMN